MAVDWKDALVVGLSVSVASPLIGGFVGGLFPATPLPWIGTLFGSYVLSMGTLATSFGAGFVGLYLMEWLLH